MIISVHIPKTGGTTFSDILSQQCGNDLLLDYPQSNTYPIINKLRKIQFTLFGTRDTIPPHIQCIHGHFDARKYRQLFPDAQYITWVRDPVQRLLSHYHFWMQNDFSYNPTYRKLKKSGFDLGAFIKMKKLQNFQSRFINTPIKKFSFVGVTEYYNESITLYKKIFNISETLNVKHERKNPTKVKEQYEIDKTLENLFLSYNNNDTQLYSEAKEYFFELCKKHSVTL